MGLFSSKKDYYAFAASSALFEDGHFPDTFKGELLQSSMVPNYSAATAIQVTLNTDLYARVKSMYKYAARYDDPTREGGYIRGLPTSNMILVSVDPSAVEMALTRSVGPYDEILSYKAGRYEEFFYLNRYIQSVWATHWDETQETIIIPGTAISTTNTPIYTRVGDGLIPEDELLLDIVGQDRFVRIGATPELDGKYDITWNYTDDGGAPATYTLSDVDIGTYISGNYIMVKYYVGADLFYWSYTVGSGTDPALESAITENAKDATFLPVAVLKQDQVWFDETADGTLNEDTELAITTNKLLKRLGTSGTDIKEDFLAQQAEDQSSRDAKKSENAQWDFFIHYAIPVNTDRRGSLEYFWEFFHDLENWSTHKWEEYYEYLASQSGTRYTKAQPINELNITESGNNGYNVSYRWSFIYTKDFPGEYIIDDPEAEGGTRPLRGMEVTSAIYERTDVLGKQKPEYQSDLDDMFDPGTPIGLYDPEHARETNNKDWERYGYHDYMIITRQNPIDPDNPEVPQGYQRMLIMGLSMQYTINTLSASSGSNGYNYRYAVPHLFGTDEETKEFRIPIQWGSLQRIRRLHREEACADGLTATVFLVYVQTTSWYQTGFFKWLIIIIAIILLVLTIIYGGGIGADSLIGIIVGALGVTGAIAFVVAVVLVFAIGFVIGLAASLIGGKAGFIFAVVAAIIMFYSSGGFNNLGSASQNLMSSPGWGSAIAFINAASPIYDIGFKVYSYNEMHKLEAEYKELLKTKKEQQQVLQDARDSFGDIPSWLDPMDLITMFERVGSSEQADTYYSRVLNANPGVLGYNLVSDFSEIALMLPQSYGQVSVVDGVFIDFAEQRRQT